MIFISCLLPTLLSLIVGSAARASEDSKRETGNGSPPAAEESEQSAKIGPDKGILEANERFGFKLSPEALKAFAVRTTRLAGGGSWQIPLSAVVRSGEEVNLYRVRDGYFKRIDFVRKGQSGSTVVVSSQELRAGDLVVTQGISYLRIAELSAFGGEAEGHGH